MRFYRLICRYRWPETPPPRPRQTPCRFGTCAEAEYWDHTPSLEVRTRLKPLLATAHNPVLPVARRRAVRAVMVLEWIGSETARRVLQRLSAPEDGYRLTIEAAAALRRLQTRDAKRSRPTP